jgi:hypothetical protein
MLRDTGNAMSEESTHRDLVGVTDAIMRSTLCLDLDEGRAAAERLAESRR